MWTPGGHQDDDIIKKFLEQINDTLHCLIVCAADNYNDDAEEYFPQKMNELIKALGVFKTGEKWPDSNYEPSRKDYSVSAPSADIETVWPENGVVKYVKVSGTSYAVPLVAVTLAYAYAIVKKICILYGGLQDFSSPRAPGIWRTFIRYGALNYSCENKESNSVYVPSPGILRDLLWDMYNGYGAIDAYDLANLAGALYIHDCKVTYSSPPPDPRFAGKTKVHIRISIINSRDPEINNILNGFRIEGKYKFVCEIYDSSGNLIKTLTLVPDFPIQYISYIGIMIYLKPGKYRIALDYLFALYEFF